MAVVGGMLTSAVLKTVGEQVGSAISGQIKLQWDFKDDLMDMKMTLESVEAFLKDAERRSITEKSVQLWLSRLKNAMYDISDMIDGFEANTTPNKSKVFSNLGAKIKMAKEMKRMRVELKKITKQHKDFSFASENTANIQEEVSSVRKTSPKVEETAIVGRIQEKRKILACLSERILTQDFIILAIYGMGGIGKTTLAQLVFNDKQFKEYSPA
uniref:Rx N-terminal domain-containing protein n=1 Tax=Oryza barthii TaxID=65489 RepID=A0A0D3HJI9_9ORYZ